MDSLICGVLSRDMLDALAPVVQRPAVVASAELSHIAGEVLGRHVIVRAVVAALE